jgi:hypothetical protein
MTASPNVAPMELDEVLSASWLEFALAGVRKGRISSVEVVETQTTVATKVRFRVEWSGAAEDDPAAGSFCVKAGFGSLGDGHRRGGAFRTEGSFYRDLADKVPVRVPHCVYVGVDPQTAQSVIVMEDLVARGARFLSALEPYSTEQAAQTLGELAKLHAMRWDGAGLDGFDWLLTGVVDRFAAAAPADLQDLLDGERGDALPADIRNAERLSRAMRQLGALSSSGPACLVHGDAHAGNLYLTAEGEPGLVDWQLLQRGHWALDVAYHLAAVLTVADRERAERDLVAHYLDRLGSHGVKAPSWSEAWDAYRRALVYGYFLWAITRRVAEPITREFVTRLGLAVAANDSFASLDQ